MSLEVHILGENLHMEDWRKVGRQIGEVFCLGIIVNDEELDDFCKRYYTNSEPSPRFELDESNLIEINEMLEKRAQESAALPVMREALRWLKAESKLECRTVYYQW